jgi:transcriptional regulator with XRE-family HTH domain
MRAVVPVALPATDRSHPANLPRNAADLLPAMQLRRHTTLDKPPVSPICCSTRTCDDALPPVAEEQSVAEATIRRALYEGDRQFRHTARRFGDEFRLQRLRAGVSQAAVARAIGVDRATICRLEAGDPGVSNEVRARAAAVVGADFRLSLYPAGSPLIHDAAHARLIEALIRLRHGTWRAIPEAPVPGGGRQSTDLRLVRGLETVLFEVETHLQVLEAVIREGNDKRERVAHDVGPIGRVHSVLVLPPTRHHRDLVRAHSATMRAAFPVRSVDLRRSLMSAGVP